MALGVVPGASHSGKKMGIMGSVLSKQSSKPQVAEILKCLTVDSENSYASRREALAGVTATTQSGKHRYVMIVFIVTDDQNDPVTDFDLFLLGGDDKSPDKLSRGFFVDRQQNAANPNHLVYYVNYDVISRNQLTGFRLIARPSEGFAYYHAVQYHSDGMNLNEILQPNETLYIKVQLHRCVDQHVFRFDNASDPKLRQVGVWPFKKDTRHSFKGEEPSGDEIDS